MQTDAIVIAAGTTEDARFTCLAPGGRKSLISVGGRPAVSHLVDSLKESERVSRVILVADGAGRDVAPNADVFVEALGSEAESVMAGVRAANGASRCLVMSGDMPLASAAAVDDFLTSAPDCDVVCPVVGKTDVEDVFPGRTVSYFRAKEGCFAASSCLLFRPETALSREEMLVSLLGARRDPKALLGIIGPWVGLKMMLSTLALKDFERYLSEALGLTCRVFITHFPELVFSIDSPDDIGLVERELAP